MAHYFLEYNFVFNKKLLKKTIILFRGLFSAIFPKAGPDGPTALLIVRMVLGHHIT